MDQAVVVLIKTSWERLCTSLFPAYTTENFLAALRSYGVRNAINEVDHAALGGDTMATKHALRLWVTAWRTALRNHQQKEP